MIRSGGQKWLTQSMHTMIVFSNLPKVLPHLQQSTITNSRIQTIHFTYKFDVGLPEQVTPLTPQTMDPTKKYKKKTRQKLLLD